MADSDTIFEEIDDIAIEQFDFPDDFYTELSASASGVWRNEEDVPGRTISITNVMKCRLLLGKYGLGSIEQGDISGTLDEFD